MSDSASHVMLRSNAEVMWQAMEPITFSNE